MLIVQFLTAALIIALDQLTKYWAVTVLEPTGKIEIISGVFNLRFVENTGAAFSILQGKTIVLIIVPIVACVAIAYMLLTKKIKSKTGAWGLSLILAGACGNLIDRVLYGAVVDMFDFCLINFPVFNVADIAVTVGAIFFFVYIIFFYDTKAEKKDE